MPIYGLEKCDSIILDARNCLDAGMDNQLTLFYFLVFLSIKSTQNQFYHHTSIYKHVIGVLMYFLISNIDVDGHNEFTVAYQITVNNK